MGERKNGRIIFTEPGYSLLTIGWMFLGILVAWLLNNLLLLPAVVELGIPVVSDPLFLSTINTLVLFMLVPYLFFRRRYIDHRVFTGLTGHLDRRGIFLCVALAIGAFMLTSVLQYFWMLLLELLGLEYAQQGIAVENIQGFIAGIVFVSAVPAVCEEYLFRGVIMRSVQGIHGNTKSIFISAALFSMMHMSISSMPTTFIVGLVLGFAVSATNSLPAGMLMHFTHNACVLVSSLLNSIGTAGNPAYDANIAPQLIVFAGLGIFLMGLTMVLLKRKGPMPFSHRVNNAAIPKAMQRDLFPFLVAAMLMLCRIFQVSI